MGIINYSDVTGAILNGRTQDKVNLHNGYILNEAVGYAKIDTTLRSLISVFVPNSNAQTPGESINSPDRILVIPTNSIITRIALRLPRIDPNNTTQFGNLQRGRILNGTTGENVKVGFGNVFTGTSPAIASVANAYVPNSSNVSATRPIGAADVPAAGLISTIAPTIVNLQVSNAGNTAAGNGISTSGGIALAIVQVCWYELQSAPTYEDLGFQSSIKGI